MGAARSLTHRNVGLGAQFLTTRARNILEPPGQLGHAPVTPLILVAVLIDFLRRVTNRPRDPLAGALSFEGCRGYWAAPVRR